MRLKGGVTTAITRLFPHFSFANEMSSFNDAPHLRLNQMNINTPILLLFVLLKLFGFNAAKRPFMALYTKLILTCSLTNDFLFFFYKNLAKSVH